MQTSVYIEYTSNMAAWFYAYFNDVTFAINDRITSVYVWLYLSRPILVGYWCKRM